MKNLLIVILLGFVGTSAHAQSIYSPAYVRNFESRLNGIINNGFANIQQMQNNMMVAAQQRQQRYIQALGGLASWESAFASQNGRPPYESEKDQWMAQNYPDLYNDYIQAKYSQMGNLQNSNQQQSTSQRNCPYCANGRVLTESNNVSSFGINIRYVTCNECGQQYNAAAGVHLHQTCTHCKGTGYLN